MPSTTETIMPTDQDAELAREFSAALAPLDQREGTAHLHFHDHNDREADLVLPQPVVRLLLDVIKEMGKGNGVSIVPIRKEFTTQQAADFLRVSRPYLIEELLEKGQIPYRKVGNRRRIRAEDLLRYRQTEEAETSRREKVMQELMAETERLGLYK
jgi:excisionase family DNA binding protein